MNHGFQYDPVLFDNAQENLENSLNELNNSNNIIEDLRSSFPSDYKYKLEVQEIFFAVENVERYNNSLCDTVLNVKRQLLSINSEMYGPEPPASNNDSKETKWYEDWGNAIKETGGSWVTGFKSLFSGNGFGDLGDAVIQTGATVAVIGKSVTDGIGKVGEAILVDGVSFLGGTIAAGGTWVFDQFAGTDYASTVMDSTLDFVRRDLVGEASEKFYTESEMGKYINENSNLKFDSAGAKAITTASEFTGKFALAVGATVLTGGAAAPLALGALYGIGQAGENYGQSVDRENGEDYNYTEALIRAGLGGTTGALEFYGYGQLGTMVLSNGGQLISALKNAVPNFSWNGIKSSLSSLGTILKTISPKNFAKNFASTFFDWDNVLDVGCVVADHGVNYAFGDESLDDLIKLGGSELLFALGLNALGSMFGAAFKSADFNVTMDMVANNVDDVVQTIKEPTITILSVTTAMPTVDLLTREIPKVRELDAITQLNIGDDYRRYTQEIMSSPCRFYQQNFDYFQNRGITFQEYIREMSIPVNSYNMASATNAAVDFSDRTMYLVYRANEILQQNGTNVSKKWASQVNALLGEKTGAIFEDQLESLLAPYLTTSDIYNLSLIGKNSLKYNLTQQEFGTIFQYTQAGGHEVINYLRGDRSRSLSYIEQWMNDFQLNNPKGAGVTRTLGGSTVIDEMTSIIDNHSNGQMITAVRHVGNLGPNVSLDLNNLDALIGQNIHDAAFGSFTLIEDASTWYSSNYNIMIKAYIEPGSGCLIQNASGLSSNTAEFLVNRSFNQTVLDAYIDIATGKVIIETVLSLDER